MFFYTNVLHFFYTKCINKIQCEYNYYNIYDNMTYNDTLRNDIMTLLYTKQINTSNYKQNI
jgi:hypothetical protein